MSAPARVVQVGLGHPHAAGIGETLLLMPEVEIVGFCDVDPALRGQPPPALAARPSFADFGEMLAAVRPDVAVITLPADLTPSLVVQAAEAGVHVYAEKPVARCAAELAPAVDAVRRAGVQSTHGYLRRFMPAGIAIERMVAQGVLGRLLSIEARWITTSVERRGPVRFYFNRARNGGGMLSWLGCHYLDFMRWVTSAEVVEVAAIAATLSESPIDVEDVATLALRYDNGMIGSLHCAFATDRDTDQAFALRGSLGSVTWDDAGPQIEARSTHPSWSTAPTRVMRFEADPVPGYGGAVGVAAFRRFIAASRGQAAPVDTIEDALRVLETLDAAHESARTGRHVRVQTTR
ncbi:MAG TPA: Gfo/Idh/MocA family oxidoreductase [Chloroflexota bacterium]